MVFQFEHVMLDQEPGKSKWDLAPLPLQDLKVALARWQTELGTEGWNSLFWENHDLPRVISRWGNDQEYREASGKFFAIILHLLKGTPYIYQGEEIGMTNAPVTDISQVADIESINLYHERLAQGYTKEAILESINRKGRDNARTPMQWDDSPNAGFTTGTPWLAVNPNYREINVAQALADENSLFYTYQKLIQLRKDHPLVVWGDFELLDTAPELFAYVRRYEGQTWLVVGNFSNDNLAVDLPGYQVLETLIHNYPGEISGLTNRQLAPWEAMVVAVAEE